MNKQTANLLEQHFDTAFAAPDGIKKLRELILTLAMQGKLVEQDPNDQPASELLKEIEAEKQRLVTAGKIKQPKPLLPIKQVEVPYDLPKGWEWVRLGEIGIINPRNNADASLKAGFVPMPLITEGFSEKHQFEERQWGEIKTGYTHFADGDVGMAKITPCFENAKSCVFSGLPNGIGAGTTELHIFRNSFNSVVPRFLLYYLKNPNYISKAVQSMTGSAGQKRVTTSYFIDQLFPLPPLSEQHRIVARIDQLMARCEELEKLRNEQDEKREAVHAAAIKQLLDAPDGSAWGFIQQHFSELYSVKENVAELRKAILQLAVMGRLVPQNPNDPPASDLLKEIEKEKATHERTKSRRKGEMLPQIKAEEMPYALPQGWEWVRLGDVARNRLGKMLDKSKNRGNPKPYLRNTNVQWHQFVLDDVKEMKFEDAELNEFLVHPGDLLICEGGEPGRCAIWNNQEIEIYFQKAIHRVRPFSCVTSEYLQICLTNDAGNGLLTKYFTGATIKHFPGDKLNRYSIPLPPLPEQHRIVARIDQLKVMCDKLDQQINAATGKQTELLNAVMAQE